jgi:hypothetical protein
VGGLRRGVAGEVVAEPVDQEGVRLSADGCEAGDEVEAAEGARVDLEADRHAGRAQVLTPVDDLVVEGLDVADEGQRRR